MDNPVNYMIKNIANLFVDPNAQLDKVNESNSLIRIHREKLKDLGDISFPINAVVWQNYFGPLVVNNELLEKLANTETCQVTTDKLHAESSKWLHYPVERLNVHKERCVLHLNRCACIKTLLQQCLGKNGELGNQPFGTLHNCLGPRIVVRNDVDCRDAASLSVYRASVIRTVLQRILAYYEWRCEKNANNEDAEPIQLHIFSVVEDVANKNRTADDRNLIIRSGLVRDPANGKLAQITTDEYRTMRTADMRLMAMHKYGIRAKNDPRFCALMERLGTAAVTVDLLEVKHSSPVQIIRNGQGSTKGASFILYNSARLETLLHKFDELVKNASYAQLPSIEDINFELLSEEEEWQLCFGYILQFPQLIARCLEQIKLGACATHLIVRYLSGFVAVFSVYYRRIRILTQETRTHLMPYVYARIYLIKAIRSVLNKTLALLNIEPVSFM